VSGARERLLNARQKLLNGSGKFSYFERRGLGEQVIRDAWIGTERDTLLYP
jgi:hypothetical protein